MLTAFFIFCAMEIYAKTGNAAFLGRGKTAFLSSRKAPDELKDIVREWVGSLSAGADCVMCGNLTGIEQYVLHELLCAGIPVILVLAEAMPAEFYGETAAALSAGKLLVVTHCDNSVHSVCARSAFDRNMLMLQLADRIVVGKSTSGGNLESALAGFDNVTYLLEDAMRENRSARERGIPVYGMLHDDSTAADDYWSRRVKLSGSTLSITFHCQTADPYMTIRDVPFGKDEYEDASKISLNRVETACFCRVVGNLCGVDEDDIEALEDTVVRSASGDVTVSVGRTLGGMTFVFAQDKDLGAMGRRHEVLAFSSSDFAAFYRLLCEAAHHWRL